MTTNTKRAGETDVRTWAVPLLFAGLTLVVACASDPPPPPQPPPPPPAAAESPPPAPEVAAAPVAEQTETPAAVEPECQAADDCKKVREPGAGMQWACENTRCVEQAAPEPVKAEATAEADKAEKTPKRTAKGKSSKKK
jgi:hypothetical protein